MAGSASRLLQGCKETLGIESKQLGGSWTRNSKTKLQLSPAAARALGLVPLNASPPKARRSLLLGAASRNWTKLRLRWVATFTLFAEMLQNWLTKLGTVWEGVSLDTLLADIQTDASYVMAHSYGDYTTNLPLDDLKDKKAWIAFRFDGRDLEPEHGGPARLLVPHLYLWKSAKWVRGITLMRQDKPGFWEGLGYHIYGDPWREQRYSGDA